MSFLRMIVLGGERRLIVLDREFKKDVIKEGIRHFTKISTVLFEVEGHGEISYSSHKFSSFKS